MALEIFLEKPCENDTRSQNTVDTNFASQLPSAILLVHAHHVAFEWTNGRSQSEVLSLIISS
jgi:hypothetical protein